MNVLALLLPAAIAALLSSALAPVARRIALRVNAVDLPGERKVHANPIPRLGGLAIVGALLAVIGVIEYTGRWPSITLPPDFSLGMIAGLVPVLIVSIIDDITPLGAKIKFLAHFGGAGIAVALGVRLNPEIHLFGYAITIGWVAIPLSMLWIAGVTNAFNIVDGLDGLAAGLALISAISLGAVAIIVGRYGTAVAALTLAGAIVGFLPWNLYPARMFMGDSGSASIGFFLACLALRGGSTTSTGLAVVLPLVVLGLPVAETLVSMARRYLRRVESGGANGMFDADRGHFHHRLLDLGLDHRRAVLTLYGVGLLLAACGFASLFLTAKYAAVLLVTLLVAAFIGIGRLDYDEFAVLRRGLALRVYDTPVLKSTIFVVFADLALVVTALYFAIVLKYDDWGLTATRMLARDLVVFVPASTVLVFWSFRQYRGAWRLAGVDDFIRSSTAVLVAAITGFTLAMAVSNLHIPATLGIIFTLLALILVNGARLSYRVVAMWTARTSHRGMPVLIYGAGVGGAMAMRELLSNHEAGMKPVGFIDDDARKKGRYLQGLPIHGSAEDASELLRSGVARGVIVSSSKVPREKLVALRALCESTGTTLNYFRIDFRTMTDLSVDPESAKVAVKRRTTGSHVLPGRRKAERPSQG